MTYITVRTAKRDRRCHNTYGFNQKGKKGIRAGERHLTLYNGGIGRNIIERNINNKDSIKMLERLLAELKEPIEVPDNGVIIWDRPEVENGFDWAADDIPF